MPSRRELIRMTSDEVDELLAGRHSMTVATIGRDGRPHLTAMWYGFLDGAPALWTYGRSQKVVNIRRDPRVTALVEVGDSYDQLRGVQLIGTAEIREDRESVDAIGESVHGRYNAPLDDASRLLVKAMGAKRVAVRIDVEKVVSWDHSKLGGTY